MTANDIVRRALILAKVMAANAEVSGTNGADALDTLRDMLDIWSAEGIAIPYLTTENYALTIGKQSYTYGTGGDFNAARPVNISDMYLRDANGNDQPVCEISQERYNSLVDKDLSGTPSGYYYVPSYPLGTIYLNRSPEAADTLYIDALKELTKPDLLADTMTFPPGYTRAIRYNLAVELAAEHETRLTDTVFSIAASSKRTIENLNIRIPTMTTDYPQRGTFDIYTGTS